MNYLFSNCSYFIGFNLPLQQRETLKKMGQIYRFPTIFFSKVSDLEQAFTKAKRIIGCIMSTDGIDLPIQENVLELSNRYLIRLKSIQRSAPESIFMDHFREILNQQIPAELAKLVLFGANTIFPPFFKKLGTFSLVSNDGEDYQQQIVYYTVADDLVGRCMIKVNLPNLLKICPGQSEVQCLNAMKECANQFLGLVNFNLGKVNLYPKVGLPSVFDLSKVPNVLSSIFIPSIHIIDPKSIVSLSLGYYHLEQRELFSLKGIPITETSDEIEFL